MIYRHEQFQLDKDRQIVYDEKGNELRIFGNEFLMLEHLCERKKATHVELAILLGMGKLYSGSMIEETMNRINGHVDSDVISLKGEDYRLSGRIEVTNAIQVEKQEEKDKTKEEKVKKGKSKGIELSWKVVALAGAGLIAAIWLIKFILDLVGSDLNSTYRSKYYRCLYRVL